METHWKEVVDYAQAHETEWSRDPRTDPDHWGIHLADPPPWNRLLGPVFARGGPSGTVWQGGREVVRWGDPTRADLTFSIAKTYLALLAGVAFDAGLLPDPQQPVRLALPGIGFDDEHNAAVTWQQLLQQTSEWSGSCFGIPDQVDHFRRLGFEPPLAPGQSVSPKGTRRTLHAPGTFWEYNDVRINQLSLALAHLFKRALPDVFRESIAQPLALSDDWSWHGYDTSWITLGSEQVQSVPGGSHWGGGVRISAQDQAGIARMMLAGGTVSGRQILSATWLDMMRAPCAIAPWYGYLLWLNTDRAYRPSAPASASFAVGAGSSVIAHLPDEDTVVVTRWIQSDAVDGLMARVMVALK